MHGKKGIGIIGYFLILVILVLAWGAYGGYEVKKEGITCKEPLSEYLCFQWSGDAVVVEDTPEDTGETTDTTDSTEETDTAP